MAPRLHVSTRGHSSRDAAQRVDKLAMPTSEENALLAAALVANAVELHIVNGGYTSTFNAVQKMLERYCVVPAEDVAATLRSDTQGGSDAAPKSRWADLVDDD